MLLTTMTGVQGSMAEVSSSTDDLLLSSMLKCLIFQLITKLNLINSDRFGKQQMVGMKKHLRGPASMFDAFVM